MHARCPECGVDVAAGDGAARSCPVCGHEWVEESSDRPRRPLYEVRAAAGGEVLGPFDLIEVREGIWLGRWPRRLLVRPAGGGGDWQPAATHPEFADVVDMVERAPVVRRRAAAGAPAAVQVAPERPASPAWLPWALGAMVLVVLAVIAGALVTLLGH